MKKLILSAIFFLLMLVPTGIYAQNDKACSDTWRSERYICGEAYSKCYEQCGATPGIAPESCYKACDKTSKACEQKANANFEACQNANKKTTPNLAVKEVQTNPEPGSKITCDQVWKIAGGENCERFVVSNDEGGVWCNLPDTRESLQPWIYGPPPTYTFEPGSCPVEGADQPQQVPSQDNNLAKKETSKQEENPVVDSIIDLVTESDIIDCRTVSLHACLRFGLPNESPGAGFRSVSGKNLEETLNWQPLITEEVLPNYIPGEENINVVKGQGEVKSPTSTQFILMNPKGDDTLQVTYLDSTVRSTSDAMQIQYIWEADSGSVINVPKWAEIKFLKPVQDEKTQEIKRMVKLNKGELEVRVKNTDSKNKFGVQGDFFDLFVVQTHFWISQSQDKKLAVIGVYEGEIEVKTKDGKTIRIKPDGDKPGVVVVSRKLSPVKLALASVVLVGIIGGIIWFLNRNKKKK